MKTLKYEEVHRNEYRDLNEARSTIRIFLEKIYNQKRLHSQSAMCRRRSSKPPSSHNAESASASPTVNHSALLSYRRSILFHRTANSVLTVCLSSGDRPKYVLANRVVPMQLGYKCGSDKTTAKRISKAASRPCWADWLDFTDLTMSPVLGKLTWQKIGISGYPEGDVLARKVCTRVNT